MGAKRKPFLNIGPGEFIKEEIEFRNWKQEDLADILGVSLKSVNQLIKNKQSITIEMARLLSKAFGQSPQYWINLDTNYRLRLQPENQKVKEVELRSLIYKYMPIKEMIKKNWIKSADTVDSLVKEVINFWEMESLDFTFLEKSANLHFRKSEAYQQFNAYYALTWFQMAKKTAKNYSASRYNKDELKTLVEGLYIYTTMDDGIPNLLARLKQIGVKFYILNHLQKTYIDGASFCDNSNPVIVYTARYDRIDNFWFTIAHEIAHILLDMKKSDQFFIDDISETPEKGKEETANQLASNILKMQEILEYFRPFKKYISEFRVLNCAKELQINPAIVVGTLQHHGFLSHRNLNRLKPKVSEFIPREYWFKKTNF